MSIASLWVRLGLGVLARNRTACEVPLHGELTNDRTACAGPLRLLVCVGLGVVSGLIGCSQSGSVVTKTNVDLQRLLISTEKPTSIVSIKSVYDSWQSEGTNAATSNTDTANADSEKTDSSSTDSSNADLSATPQPGLVTIAGRIYAEGMSPFDPKESVFTVIELPKPGHNHEDPGDCPFCKHELKNAKIAIVRVVGKRGKTYPQSAETLLGLTKNQDITVTGKAKRVGDSLVIDLQCLYLLSKEESGEQSTVIHGSN